MSVVFLLLWPITGVLRAAGIQWVMLEKVRSLGESLLLARIGSSFVVEGWDRVSGCVDRPFSVPGQLRSARTLGLQRVWANQCVVCGGVCFDERVAG